MRRMMRKSLDLKVVLLGRAYDGKSSLVERFIYKREPSNITTDKSSSGSSGSSVGRRDSEPNLASPKESNGTAGEQSQKRDVISGSRIRTTSTVSNPHQSTIGAAYSYKNIVHNSRSINVSLLDTAGNERYESLNRFFIRGAKATIVVVDISQAESIEKARYWLAQIEELEPECEKYLCVTKMDLIESSAAVRLLSDVDLQEMAQHPSESSQRPAKLFYTSALTGQGVQELFAQIVSDYYARYQAERKSSRKPGLAASLATPATSPARSQPTPPTPPTSDTYVSTASRMFSKALAYSGLTSHKKDKSPKLEIHETDMVVVEEAGSRRTPMNECSEAFDAVHAILSSYAKPTLIANCKRLHDACQAIATFAAEYDFSENIHANGYWSFIRLVVKYYDLILTTYRPKGEHDDKLISISEILLVQYRILQEMRADSLASEERQVTPSLSPLKNNNNVNANGKSPDKRNRSVLNQVRNDVELAQEAAEMDHEQRVKGQAARPTADLFASHRDEFGRMLQVYFELENQLQYIYGRYCSFWLCPSMRRAMMALTVVMGMYVTRTGAALRCLWDREHRGQIVTRIAQSANLRVMKNICNLNENSLIHSMPKLWSKAELKVARDIFVPRQSEWIIPPNGAAERRNPTSEYVPAGGNKIRCRLLVGEMNKPSPGDTVLLHCHGGGFISQSPDTHEVYLREWASRIDNVPLVSVAYSLSPEETFPVALQQLLDVYLWLSGATEDKERDKESLREIFGFEPKRIVVVGDSAGGNMNTALLLVLADINRIIYGTTTAATAPRSAPISFPSAIVLLYTPLLLKTIISPSRIFSMLDTLLSFGLLLCCLDAYLSHHKYSLDKNKFGTPTRRSAPSTPNLKRDGRKRGAADRPDTPPGIPPASEAVNEPTASLAASSSAATLSPPAFATPTTSATASTAGDAAAVEGEQDFGDEFVDENFDGDIPPNSDQILGVLQNALRRIREKFTGNSNDPTVGHDQAWYKLPPAELMAKLDQLNTNATNLYVSPLLLQNWDDFADVPLYLIGLHFDACLDDMITIAKRWKGPVSLDVLNDLPHGFLNFITFSDEAKRGCDLCVTRLRQALLLPPANK